MIPKITIDREQAEWVVCKIGDISCRHIAICEIKDMVLCVNGNITDEGIFINGGNNYNTHFAHIRFTTFTGEKVFPITSTIRPSTIEEIALEVQMNCNDPKFCWKADYGSCCIYRPEIITTDTAYSYQKALRSSPTDTTPLADLKWGEFETEVK